MTKVNPIVSLLYPNEAQYPPLLRQIPKPPQRLYVRGNSALLQHQPLLAIVGTRRASEEGLLFTRSLVAALNRTPDIVTVSGLAFGIDGAVAESAVAAHRPTIAVLGSSVEQPTPTNHQRLAEEILANGGCLVSEYPYGTPAHKSHFPARNRIIAGLSQATLVTEAGEPSGALITAYLALDFNRDVLAVPGSPLNAAAAGTNALIKRGAVPVTSAQDVLEVLGFPTPLPRFRRRTPDNFTDLGLTLLQHLSHPRTLDQLAAVCTMAPDQLHRALSLLELDGRVTILPDSRIVATP